MRKFLAIIKNVKTLYGYIPAACGILNNFVFPVIPITPLLRGLAALILLVTCSLAILWALSVANDMPKDRRGNIELRKKAIKAGLVGIGLLIAYFVFVKYFNQHDVQNQVLNTVVDVIQALLFASPWTSWSAAFVLMAPRK